MDQQLHDSSSFERAFAVAQQRHKETVSELHRLREELRARDDVIKSLQRNLGDRFDAVLECRLLKDQLKKLQEGMREVVGEDERRHREDDSKTVEGDAASGEINASNAAIQLAKKGKNCVAKLSLEYLADILGYLDRFSLDRVEFTCPKLRAAVATLDGQNYRDLIRLEVTRAARDENGRRVCGRGRGGFFSRGQAASGQRRQTAQNSIAIVVECSSDPMAMKNGATSANGMLDWDFVDTPKATAHFTGLLRNASVKQLSLNNSSHQFIQALSDADVDVVVGSLSVGSFSPEAAILADGRDSLIPFNRLEKLAINDAPLDLLSDDYLLVATQKHVTSITLKSDRFRVRDGSGYGRRRTIEAAVGSECDYPELCDGVLEFLFREDLDESAKVELRFPVARIPVDFCQHLMESAISAGTRYSIDASFVAVGDINEDLVGFEEYRRLGEGYDNGVATYQVPDPNTADVIVELKIATLPDDYDDWSPSNTVWKLIEFCRFRSCDGIPTIRAPWD